MKGEFSRPSLSSAQAPEQFFRYSNYPKRALSRGKPIKCLINRCNPMFAVGARGRRVDGFISTGHRFPCSWGPVHPVFASTRLPVTVSGFPIRAPGVNIKGSWLPSHVGWGQGNLTFFGGLFRSGQPGEPSSPERVL